MNGTGRPVIGNKPETIDIFMIICIKIKVEKPSNNNEEKLLSILTRNSKIQ